MENQEAINAIRSGDREAIKIVYKEHAKDVYNFAKSITGDQNSAMEATKKTFINLFTGIQKGENPANIRLAALKLAYDEACRIAMPSTADIDSPFDRQPEDTQAKEETSARESVSSIADEEINRAETAAADHNEIFTDAGDFTRSDISLDEDGDICDSDQPQAYEDGISDEHDEKEDIPYDIDGAELDITDEEDEESDKDDDWMGNTVVFNIKEALGDSDDEIELGEEDEDEDDIGDENDEEDGEKRGKASTVIIVIINVILVLILLWLLYGLLVSFDIIPDVIHLQSTYDLFNEKIYPIF